MFFILFMVLLTIGCAVTTNQVLLHSVYPLSQEKEVHMDLRVNVGRLVHQEYQEHKDQREVKENQGRVTCGGM